MRDGHLLSDKHGPSCHALIIPISGLGLDLIDMGIALVFVEFRYLGHSRAMCCGHSISMRPYVYVHIILPPKAKAVFHTSALSLRLMSGMVFIKPEIVQNGKKLHTVNKKADAGKSLKAFIRPILGRGMLLC